MACDRIEVNTELTALVQRFGVELTDADDDALNDLTHTVADFIDERRGA